MGGVRNKTKAKILAASIAVLASIAPIVIFAAYASSGQVNTPIWTPCNTSQQLYVENQYVAVVGHNYMSNSWSAPRNDWDWALVCFENGFDNIQFDGQVYNSGGQQVATMLTDVETNPFTGAYLYFVQGTCSCGGLAYYLQSGDRISVTITVRYGLGGVFYHTGGFGFYVS